MLADDLAAVLAQRPGLTVPELCASLGGEKGEREVTRALFARHRWFRCDRGQPRRWWLATGTPAGAGGGGWRRPGETGSGGSAVALGVPVAVSPGLSGLSGLSGLPGDRSPRAAGSSEDGLPRAAGSPEDGLHREMPGQVSGGSSRPLRLYRWQADALAAWERRHRRGVVEAVTGTGKTMVGITAAVAELEAREQVLVLVPTVDLQRQWVDQLSAWLPGRTRIGRLGGGARDRLASHDVLVAVVNSARAADVQPIRRGGLLVADECHRYGSAANHLSLDPRFAHRLGLSATYGRDDDGNRAWLDPYFGGTCFQMGYRRALAEEVTAHFTVALVGVALPPPEQELYEQLSREMAQLRARLLAGYGLPGEPLAVFMAAVNALADGAGDGSGVARQYRATMLARRRLLADTPAKDDALAVLAPAVAGAERAFVFTQSIAASERISSLLGRLGLAAGVVHSDLPAAGRRDALERFSAGALTVMVAPRVLDEGIDVPAADLAVIAGASNSRRQMVQRMGRVLRRKDDGRLAHFVVLYAEDTVEDPHRGAHEAYLDEVLDLADDVGWFPAGMSEQDAGVVGRFLARLPTGGRRT